MTNSTQNHTVAQIINNIDDFEIDGYGVDAFITKLSYVIDGETFDADLKALENDPEFDEWQSEFAYNETMFS